LYDVITQQDYFTNNDEILIQRNGLAMGAPTSGMTAEFFSTKLRTPSFSTPMKLNELSNLIKISPVGAALKNADRRTLQSF